MRITVVAYVEQEGSQDCDVVIPQVIRALESHGHTVETLFIHSDVLSLIGGIRENNPDLVFNLVESFANDMVGGLVAVTGALDLLRVPYTGGGPGEMYLQEDKSLSKKLLAYEKILYPNFAVFSKNSDFETGGNLRMPLFVKPLRNDASIGIDAQKALVKNAQELLERVGCIHREVDDAALAEEYIEGREFYVGVLGNQEMIALPPIEMDFSGLAGEQPKVLDNRAKFDENSAEYKGTRAIVADLEPELAARLQNTALTACRAVRVRDYGRVDIRLAPTGDIYVLEVNANCYLEEKGEFVMAAAAAGIEYPDLIQKIVELSLARHKPMNAAPQKSAV